MVWATELNTRMINKNDGFCEILDFKRQDYEQVCDEKYQHFSVCSFDLITL